MAERTGRRAAPAEPKPPAKPTQRVVLKRERVLVLPDGVDLTDLDPKVSEPLRKALGIKGGKANAEAHVEAWVVVGEYEGSDKRDAIEAYAGVPDTPDAKPGVYKAPGLTAWKGGRHYEKPPEPKVEAKDID